MRDLEVPIGNILGGVFEGVAVLEPFRLRVFEAARHLPPCLEFCFGCAFARLDINELDLERRLIVDFGH